MRISLLKKVCAIFGAFCLLLQGAAIAGAAEISSVTSGEAEIGYWAPCTDELKVKLSEDAPEDIEVSLTDLGTSLLYDEDKTIELSSVTAEGSELIISLTQALSEGHRYKLKAGDSEVTFKATESGGMAEIPDKVTFEGLSDADLNNAADARPENDTYVIGDEGLIITKTAKETRISIADDETSTGGKALKVIGRGTIDKDFLQGTAFRSGKLKIEARVKVVSGTFELGIGNSTGVVNVLTAEADYAKLSYQNSTSTSSGIKTKAVNAPENGYTTISYEMDLDNKSASYIANGGEGTLESGKMPYISSKGSILNSGIEFIQLEGSPAAGEYIIDYITTTIYKDAADVKSVTLKDIENSDIVVTKNETVTPGIKEIDISFNSDMDADTLAAISVSDADGAEVPTVGAYDDFTRTYTLTLTEYLGQLEEYYLNIPKGILALDDSELLYDYSEKLTTGEGETKVASFKLTDKTGNTINSIYELGDSVVVTAEILNTKQAEGKMSIVYTEGKDKLMTKMLYRDFELDPGDRKAELSFTVEIEDGADISEISAFLWNNLKEHIPQYRAAVLR